MKKNNKGFTLAELLIVVAIIAVLVAIAIPIFTSQLEKSREATDAANIRDYYAEIAVCLVDGSIDIKNGESLTISGGASAAISGVTDATASADGAFVVTVSGGGFKVNQTQSGWQNGNPVVAGVAVSADMSTATSVIYTFAVEKGHGNTYLNSVTFGVPAP